MPRQTEPQGFEESLLSAIGESWEPMVRAMERALGPASGTTSFTKEDQIRMATFTPYPDPAQRQQAIITLLQQGATQEQVTDEIYPQLRKLISLAGPKIKDQIAYAKQLRTEIDKHEEKERTEATANAMADLLTETSPEQSQWDDELPLPDVPTEPTNSVMQRSMEITPEMTAGMSSPMPRMPESVMP